MSGQHLSSGMSFIEKHVGCRTAADDLCAYRDPVYFKIKSTLWDLFPAWEDRQVDAAFREMLWASQGCESPPCWARHMRQRSQCHALKFQGSQ